MPGPLFVAWRRHHPPAGGSLSLRRRPWQRGQVSSLPVNGRKKPSVKLQTIRPCQSLSLSGEVARRSRDGEGRLREEPSQSPTATAPPRGGALGRTSKFRPQSSTAGRSQPLSGKLFAPAKASPFRERWHGEAVTERVASGKNPLSRLRRQLVPLFVACRRHLPPAGGSLSKGEPLARRAGLVLTSQRQEEASR